MDSELSAAGHHCTSSAGAERSCTSRPWLVPERSRASSPEELNWLPVVYRIKFKLALVMFTIHTHQCPDYPTDYVHSYSNNDPARYRLRSATGTVLCSTYEDEIWRQSSLCGRASRVEQFASGSSSRGQFTLF